MLGSQRSFPKKWALNVGEATSILAWEIPWTEEPGRLQFMQSQKSQTQLNNNKQRQGKHHQFNFH